MRILAKLRGVLAYWRYMDELLFVVDGACNGNNFITFFHKMCDLAHPYQIIADDVSKAVTDFLDLHIMKFYNSAHHPRLPPPQVTQAHNGPGAPPVPAPACGRAGQGRVCPALQGPGGRASGH